MNDARKTEPLSSEALQSEDDKGGGVTLTPDAAPGHTLPASETGAEPEPPRTEPSILPNPPD